MFTLSWTLFHNSDRTSNPVLKWIELENSGTSHIVDLPIVTVDRCSIGPPLTRHFNKRSLFSGRKHFKHGSPIARSLGCLVIHGKYHFRRVVWHRSLGFRNLDFFPRDSGKFYFSFHTIGFCRQHLRASSWVVRKFRMWRVNSIQLNLPSIINTVCQWLRIWRYSYLGIHIWT